MAGRQTKQDGGEDAAPSNRAPVPHANSDAELEAWEDEGGTIDQPLAGSDCERGFKKRDEACSAVEVEPRLTVPT